MYCVVSSSMALFLLYQWRSQNAEKIRLSGETTRSSSDSLQLRPFSKSELLLKVRIRSQEERIAPKGSEFFPLRAVLYSMKYTFITLDDLP